MKVSVTIPADSMARAEKKAREAFAEFFGKEEWRIVSEEAHADTRLITHELEVLSWDVTYVAEDGAA